MSSKDKVPVSVDDLLEKYGAPESETFEIKLPKGEAITFRRLRTYSELRKFLDATKEFVKQNLQDKHPRWDEIGPRDEESLSAAFAISELSVDPKFDMFQAFQLAQAGWLTTLIMSQLDANRMRFQIMEAEAARVKSEKNA